MQHMQKSVWCHWNNRGRNQRTRNQFDAKVSVDTWKSSSTDMR